MSQPLTGSGYVQTIITGEVNAFAQGHRAASTTPVDITLRVRFNPTLNKSWFGAVIQVVNQVTMLSIILTGAALIREREHGTIEHLLVMPVTPFEIMTSKVCAMGLVVLGACAFSLAGDHSRAQKGMRVPAGDIEALVLDRLRAFSK